MKETKIVGDLGIYEVVATNDGSLSLHSPYFLENCHSMSGAYSETMYNYVEGCKLERARNINNYTIFEVGFATGLGLRCSLDFLSKNSLKNPIHFISCELDKRIVLHFIKMLPCSNIQIDNETNIIKANIGHHTLTILIGDIRKTILNWSLPKVHAIYHDPFSPKRNPTLWTHQFFKNLYEISHQDCILSTYSSTKSVWKAMIKSGWVVEKVLGYGEKRLSTRAKKSGEVSQELKDLLERSPAPALCDLDLGPL